MPTLINRPTTAKGYTRTRQNLSRQLRCAFVGSMTQQEFHTFIDTKCDSLTRSVRSVEFYRNKATIHCWDKTMLQFSYKQIKH